MRKLVAPAVAAFAIATVVSGCDGGNAAMSSQRDERIAKLEAGLAKAQQRITLLEDYDAITNLNRIYGYYLDKALFDQLVDLFTDDVSLEYSGRGVYIGKERAKQLMTYMPGGKTGLQDGMLQNHMQLQGVIHVAPDGQTAKGRWRALIMMSWPNKTASWQEGIYENEYRKEGGVWKFSKVHFYLNVNADYQKGWATGYAGVPGVDKNFPPDQPPSDPGYKPYPAAFIPPFHYKNPVTGK